MWKTAYTIATISVLSHRTRQQDASDAITPYALSGVNLKPVPGRRCHAAVPSPRYAMLGVNSPMPNPPAAAIRTKVVRRPNYAVTDGGLLVFTCRTRR